MDCNKLPNITVSLTSYPKRIPTLATVLAPIFQQTYPADRVALWLAEDQFPHKERDLPDDLLMLKEKMGLEIHWCDDLKPHKKYYYAIREFPEDIIITIDDDIVYSKTLIETLMRSYCRYPNAVSAMRVHKIIFDEYGFPQPYKKWKKECNEAYDAPSMIYMATGSGGILYPPHCLHHEVFNKQEILKTCLYGDDLWLKVMEVMNNTPVVLADKHSPLREIASVQDVALWHKNVNGGMNDSQLTSILKKYNTWFGESDTLTIRMDPSANFRKPKISVVIPVYNAESYLSITLDSVLAQTCDNIEVICINDGSTDSSEEILKAYQLKDERIKIISISNSGPGPARNIGIDAATGDYLIFCDADDYLPPRSFEFRMRAALEKNSDIVVGCYREIVDSSEIRLSAPLAEMKEPFWMIYASSVVLWNKLFKMDFIKRAHVSFRNLKQGEDRIYITELFCRNPTVTAISDYIYDWNRRPSEDKSLSFDSSFSAFQERIESWLETYKLFQQYHIVQASQLLINWSPYLKSLFDNVRSYDDRLIAFEKIKALMQYANWNLAKSKFRQIWGVEAQSFFQMDYTQYSHCKLNKDLGPTYWYYDQKRVPKMKPYEGTMPIVLVADDGYALPLGIFLTSIKINRAQDSNYEINIISDHISDHNKTRLLSLSETNFIIKFVEVADGDNKFNSFSSTSISSLPATLSAMYKFYIPTIFKQYDKILYLDCDMLVLCDLKPLFDLDLTDRYAAVSVDSLQFLKPPHLKRIQCSNKTYFNSGVMLLNLQKMREDNIVESLIEYRKNGINYYMDQDAFNVVFNDCLVYIPFYYNLDYTAIRKFKRDELCKFYHISKYSRLPILYRRAKIVHFTGFDKPWKRNVLYFTDLYDEYKKQSPFSDIPLVRDDSQSSINTALHFCESDVNHLQTEVLRLRHELNSIYSSKSYKIGQLITFVPRKIRGGIWCYREHGLRYTFCRLKEQMSALLRR